MNRLEISVAVFSLLLLGSCKKEFSVENGFDPNNPPLGNNCRLSSIISADSATSVGLGSFNTRFDANLVANQVDAYDSIQGASVFNTALVSRGDTLRVSANEYFLIGSNKRALSFHSHVNPADPTSNYIDFIYSYDGSGYLTKKEIFREGVAIPVVRYVYVWAGGNLASVDGSVVIPGQEAKLFSATMQYDSTRTIRNFMPLFPDGYEHFTYDMAVDLGTRNRNPLLRIDANYYDGSGNVNNTVTNLFSGHKYSADNYLLECDVTGSTPVISTLLPGKNKFVYTCK